MAMDAVPIGRHDEHELAPWLIVLIASTDGITTVGKIVSVLPKDLPASVIVIQHRTTMVPDMLANILRMRAMMPVEPVGHGQPLETGKIYVPRPDLHLTIDREGRFKYFDGTRIHHVLSSADPLLQTAAEAFRSRVIAVILTGRGDDGAAGVTHVRAHGGIVIVQDPATIEHGQMPEAAIATGQANAVLPLAEIAPRLIAVVRRDGAAREALEVAALQR